MVFHCLVASAGLQWSAPQGRWASQREELALLGIDATKSTSSFSVGRRSSMRKRAVVHSQVGNGQNIAHVTAMLIVAALNYKVDGMDESLMAKLKLFNNDGLVEAGDDDEEGDDDP
jgi:hypothetical protein